MPTPRVLACLSLLAFTPLLKGQTPPPTAYTITEATGDAANPGTTTIYRNGNQAVIDIRQAAQPGTTAASRTVSLYDLKAGVNHAWTPDASPVECSAGRFSGDWGDPFAMTADLSGDIAKGDLKPTGEETLNGIATTVYEGTTQGTNIKAWLDRKDGLVIRATYGAPGGPLLTLVDIRKVSLAPPPASVFALPAACAGVNPAASPADLIAAETGDDAANYVNGIYGPGSTNSCSVVLRVVKAKTMTPITHIQVAIDTTYNQNNPPHYEFGVHNDGSQTYSGGGIHEITNLVHDGVARLGTPPAYFMLGVNPIEPGHAGGMGLVYRQCFAPTTVLLYVVKDYGTSSESGDFLWVKAGKYAVPPAH
ncbi:MAG: hypothetical protein ACLQG3_13465 [Terracidiphilus sp.]